VTSENEKAARGLRFSVLNFSESVFQASCSRELYYINIERDNGFKLRAFVAGFSGYAALSGSL
jgi:hypothetical protein